jgi:hypothetical protein
MYTVHGDLAALAIGDVEVFSDLLKCDTGTRTSRPVHGRHLLCLGIVEEAEHVTTNTGGARFCYIDGCCNSYCCILHTISMLLSALRCITSYRGVTTFPQDIDSSGGRERLST